MQGSKNVKFQHSYTTANYVDYKPIFREYNQIFILVTKANEMHSFSNLFDKVLYMWSLG
jgi:hypothetical protein